MQFWFIFYVKFGIIYVGERKMRVVVQRVKRASLDVSDKEICKIGQGLVCFVGFCNEDDRAKFEFIAKRIAGLRVFEDENGKMNKSPNDVGAEFMLVSNFTLYGDVKDGFRPSFTGAMAADKARQLFYDFVEFFKTKTSLRVESGVFGADMQILQQNDGPITLIIEN